MTAGSLKIIATWVPMTQGSQNIAKAWVFKMFFMILGELCSQEKWETAADFI